MTGAETPNYEDCKPVKGSESNLSQVENKDPSQDLSKGVDSKTSEELKGLADDITEGYPNNDAGEQIVKTGTILSDKGKLPPYEQSVLDGSVDNFKQETGEAAGEVIEKIA